MKNKSMYGKKKKSLLLMVLVLPFLIQVIIFNYLPMWSWVMAVIDYQPGVPVLQSEFVGLKYFIQLFSGGSEFLIVVRNTLVLGFLSFLSIPLSILLAILINECKGSKFKRFAQSVSALPNFISWVIVFSIFFNFLAVNDGFINILLIKIGIIQEGINFLGTEAYVWPLQTFIAIWKSVGWSAIIFLSAIAGIDNELYQAASIDGANRLQRNLYITIPGIMPTITVIMLLSVSSILSQGFEQYFMFHNGLVHSSIEIIDTYAYRKGIAQGNFSFATAVSVFKTVVSVLLLVFVNTFSKKTTGQSIL